MQWLWTRSDRVVEPAVAVAPRTPRRGCRPPRGRVLLLTAARQADGAAADAAAVSLVAALQPASPQTVVRRRSFRITTSLCARTRRPRPMAALRVAGEAAAVDAELQALEVPPRS